ncbi:MAG: methyltransferase domain-containing protein, partial [Alphaproteobacteria bacterium]
MLLRGVIEERRPLEEPEEGTRGPLARLGRPDRARALALARDVLRFWGRSGAVLAPLVSRKPRPALDALLRLAVTEHRVQATPPHAVVASWVGLARRDHRLAPRAGFVNAVLRRALVPEALAAWDEAGPTRLPEWIGARVAAQWGEAVRAAIEAAHERGAPIDLTPRSPDLAPAIARSAGGEILPTGSVRLRTRAQVSRLPGFGQGAFWVQDAASALPVALLGELAGRSVLDLCAAPGGKTMQLAAAGARVTAVDASERRMARLRQNLERTRLKARTVVADIE